MESLNPIERETARRLRTALVRPIPQRVADEHLSAMRAARRRPRGWSTVLAAAAALLVAGGAMALPGHVDLPDAVDDPPRPAGAREGPPEVSPAGRGQDTPGTLSDAHGEAVSGVARTTTAEGREKGKQVSEIASSKSVEHRNDGNTPSANPVGSASASGDGGKPDETPGKGPASRRTPRATGPGARREIRRSASAGPDRKGVRS